MIEASSLSALTALADNPPLHLSSRTQLPRDPLVLYIARVPGSQDVFLTPLKPRDRVVSDTDVASCLYYCHVDAAADVPKREVLQEAAGAPAPLSAASDDAYGTPSASSRDDGPEASSLPPPHSVLPEAVTLEPPDQSPDQPDIPFPHPRRPEPGGRPSSGIARKPVGAGASPRHDAGTPPSRSPSPRKALGPRPLLAPPGAARRSVDAAATGSPSPPPNGATADARRWSATPRLPGGGALLLSPRDDDGGVLRAPNGFDADPAAPAVTLIRRDPGSGAQWNVGRIALIPSAKAGKGRAAGAALQIDTAGYAQFASGAEPPASPEQPFPATAAPAREKPTFLRWLSLQPPSSPSPKRNGFRASVDDLTRSVTPTNGDPPAFAFESPWAGTCAFTTGVAGRGLKCRHHTRAAPTAVVSELRPNLPGSRLLAPRSPQHRSPFTRAAPSPTPSPSPRRPLSALLGSANASNASVDADVSDDGGEGPDVLDDDDEGPGVVDYALGRERAGGGRRGRTAKLGKLVVEGAGMAMLDLVVAANMGVWWSLATRHR